LLLDIKNLKTYYRMNNKIIKAVDGVSFKLKAGENLGLVGESGCGKTTTAKSINRILPSNGGIVDGNIYFQNQDLVQLSERELNKIRWHKIAMVTQSAMNALNPVYTIGDQMVEAFQSHIQISKQEALKRSAHLFSLVGLEKSRLNDYPHQLSGGMKQRVVIAMAMSLDPPLIIADEPTTALDVVVQDGILKKLVELQEKIKSSIILVTHDISVVAELCQRVAVMYAGRIMEQGTTWDIYKNAYHPYTLGLINAFPTIETAKENLISIPGSPPNLADDITGCCFKDRCPFATDLCRQTPVNKEISPGHEVACHYLEKVEEFRKKANVPSTWGQKGGKVLLSNQKRPAVLQVDKIKKVFNLKSEKLFFRQPRLLKAVDGVTFNVRENEILGLAGESGSGKSTLGELIARLQNSTSGKILYLGSNIAELKKKELKKFRKKLQVVFQDPYETLNPRFTVLQTVMEPLTIHNIGEDFFERVEKVKTALIRSELTPPEQYLERFPHQLSGGQRQRVALARAIILEPEFIIADEPVSMLDVSVRAGILNLLRKLRDELGVSVIYISHDLATIRYICDRTAILYLGRIMEIGDTESVITNPSHPYTRMLLSAVPIPDPTKKRERVDPRGEIPDPIDLPNGCRFHTRCVHATPNCGFEGRDVQHIIVLAQNHPDYPNIHTPLRNIEKTEISGCAIKITIFNECGNRDELENEIKSLMNEWNQAFPKAVTGWSWHENILTISFDKKAEPELRPAPGKQQVACVLYNGINE